MSPRPVPNLGDGRVVYLALPGSTWTYLWTVLLAAAIEEHTDGLDPLAPPPDQVTRKKQALLLIALRQAVRLSAPALLDQAIAEGDDLQLTLFRSSEPGYTAEEEALAQSLAVDPERELPATLEKVRKLLAELEVPKP